MEISPETIQKMDVDQVNAQIVGAGKTLMKAKELVPENDQNVLFQPNVGSSVMEDPAQSDGQSLSTNVNDKQQYEADVDPTMLTANTV